MWITLLTWLSSALMPFFVFYIISFGLVSKRPVFEDFLKGAKEGMKTTKDVFPSLLGLLVAVGALRASGFLDFLAAVLQKPLAFIRTPAELVPVILLRLVSNSAATGIVLDIFNSFGPDSKLGLMASLLLSSTETVFYCLSIYFGSVGIRKTRFTLPGALFATFAGVAASIFLGGIIA